MSGHFYLDSSAILAHVYGEKQALAPEFVLPGCTSALSRVECLRSIDRHRLQGRLTDEVLSVKRQAVFRTLRALRLVDLDAAVLDRASGAFPAPLGTLDAIHLATALALAQEPEGPPIFATHDRRLAAAARTYGLEVVGA